MESDGARTATPGHHPRGQPVFHQQRVPGAPLRENMVLPRLKFGHSSLVLLPCAAGGVQL